MHQALCDQMTLHAPFGLGGSTLHTVVCLGLGTHLFGKEP